MSRIAAIIMVLFLGTAPVGAHNVYTDNVVIVLDSSGSMNVNMRGTSVTRLNAARNAIKDVVKMIDSNTQIGVLIFGSRADGWIYPLGPRNDAELFAALDRLRAEGGTPLGQYMKIGADRLLQARAAQYGYGSYRLLIVTDGEAGDQKLVDRYTPDIIARGIITDVIGLDMAKDHTLATKVHSYRSANDPVALGRALREVFAELEKADDNGSGTDVFAELDGFPETAAMAIVTALSASGNQPIGEAAAAAAVTAKSPSSPTVAAPPAPPTPASPPPRSKTFPVAIIMFLVFGVFLSVAKSRR